MTETANNTSARFFGCDVGKDEIVICDADTGEIETVANRPQALVSFFAALPGAAFLVCEATGGYEAALLAAAHEAGADIHRADPRKARAFARSLRSFGKTDDLDALALALYGKERHATLPRWKPTPQAFDDLQKLVRLRIDLVQCRADYKRREKAPGSGPDKAHITRLIDSLSAQIADIEADIETCLNTQHDLRKTVDVIQAIPGCGQITAITIAGLLPEVGLLSRRQVASLGGLAPHPDRSGKRDGYRSTCGGRQDVKRAMFLAVLSAKTHNPVIKQMYDRLIAKGKKKMVALVACARKLLTIINAKVRDAVYAPTKQLS